MHGFFLSFEGAEGCGKSTQIKLLHRRLIDSAKHVTLVREPGGTPPGELIRHLLQHAPEGESLAPEAELLLFAASRAQLVRQLIAPALDQGQIVIADRFHDSTTVYQGAGRGLDRHAIAAINAFATGPHLPQLTFLLEVPQEVAEARLAALGTQRDRIERAGATFFERVRDGYRALALAHPGRIVTIDGSLDPTSVASQIWLEFSRRYDALAS